MTSKGAEKMNPSTLGVDVSKDFLDAHRLADGDERRFANDKTGRKALIKWLSERSSAGVTPVSDDALHPAPDRVSKIGEKQGAQETAYSDLDLIRRSLIHSARFRRVKRLHVRVQPRGSPAPWFSSSLASSHRGGASAIRAWRLIPVRIV
jgi:hypothetical protein